MQPNIRYIVTKGSPCNTLQVGDYIYLMTDGTLLNKSTGGWLSIEDSERLIPQTKMRVDKDWMEKVLKQQQETLNDIREAVNAPTEDNVPA